MKKRETVDSNFSLTKTNLLKNIKKNHAKIIIIPGKAEKIEK